MSDSYIGWHRGEPGAAEPPGDIPGRRKARTWLLLFIGLTVLLIVGSTGLRQLASAALSGTGAEQDPIGVTMTRHGPLSPADRDFLVKVRTAGLWETPTGRQAKQRAGSDEVKDAGAHIATEHIDLDAKVRSVAQELDVTLPNQPTAEQQGWMSELSRLTGADYDRVFVARLRAAHGKVFGVIAGIRASTRNDLVRSFASTANTFVLRHMTYLESTGLVDYAALPAPPALAATAPAGQTGHGPHHPTFTGISIGTILLIVVATAVLNIAIFRSRRFNTPP
jgi:putative membrane protein